MKNILFYSNDCEKSQNLANKIKKNNLEIKLVKSNRVDFITTTPTLYYDDEIYEEAFAVNFIEKLIQKTSENKFEGLTLEQSINLMKKLRKEQFN